MSTPTVKSVVPEVPLAASGDPKRHFDIVNYCIATCSFDYLVGDSRSVIFLKHPSLFAHRAGPLFEPL
jgi:hypothetical protein